MERQVSTHDIHKIVNEDLVEMYKHLANALGDKNPFAKFSIGGGFYVWADNRCAWRQMISASSLEQEIVRSSLYELKKSIATIIGEEATEKLTTTPDDSHIYYSYDNAEIKILLTGWGFKKPARAFGKSDIEEMKQPNPVTLSFSIGDEKQPCYEFGVQLPRQVKHMRTGLDGLYHFRDLKVGESFTIVDFKSNKNHSVNIVEGVSHYDIDISNYTTLTIQAQDGGQPLANETAEVLYNGKSHSVTTNEQGVAQLQLPYVANTNIVATLRDQTKVEPIAAEGNTITFSLNAKVETNIEVFVVANGEPVANKMVSITYGEQRFSGLTNENGSFVQHVAIDPTLSCEVAVDGFETQSKPLAETEINYFRFEQENVGANGPEPYIIVVNEKGEAEADYPIRVDFNGTPTSYVSDENGIVKLPSIADGTDMLVVDENNGDNYTVYKVYSTQQEYIFRVNKNLDIKVTILDHYQRPIRCESVCFFQQNTNIKLETSLDGNGSTTFATETFIKHNEIEVTLEGCEKAYGPIIFSIVDDEYEYVLQEEKPKTPWLNIVLQILTLLAMIAVATGVWFACDYLGSTLFNLIYR